MANPSATIYLAEQRGITQQDAIYRSWHTFNYGEYQDPHREAPGALRVFNEETLAGGKQMTYTSQEIASVILLPLVGGILVQAKGKVYELEAGGVLEFPLGKGEVYQLQNPYTDLVSYLQIEVQLDDCPIQSQVYTVDLEQYHNALQVLLPPQKTFQLSIGKFDGRADVVHVLTKPQKSCFVFVIDGVFEVQNRLLHARDGLYLIDDESIEFEALANEAIFLILEF